MNKLKPKTTRYNSFIALNPETPQRFGNFSVKGHTRGGGGVGLRLRIATCFEGEGDLIGRLMLGITKAVMAYRRL